MEGLPFLHDIVTLLAAAIIIILLSQRLRIPPLVGLLLTGVLIGPSGFGLVSETEEVRLLAELGVVALLFTIGLEFSLERLRQIQRFFFLGGSQQALWTLLITFLVSLALGASIRRAIFFGFLVTLSSTAIVLKIYGERREIDAPQGRMALGILLFQDFLVVPMIILTPVLAGVVAASPLTIGIRFGGGILIVLMVFYVARSLMPRLLHLFVQTKIRELLVLGALFAGLGMALVTESLQFSMALGAFLAGLIISESEYSHQIVADMLPFRDVFASIFFVSIGMLLDTGFLVDRLGYVLALAFGLILLKFIVVVLTVLTMRLPIRTAILTGASLAQVGEFSFVVANVGWSNDLLGPVLYQGFIASSIITMMMTPPLIALAPHLSTLVEKILPLKRPVVGAGAPEQKKNHVIVVGFGVNGRNLVRVLREVQIPYVVVELDGEIVRQAIQQGEPMIFGDVTRKEILELAHLDTASVIVFGISDPMAVRRAIRFTRQINPQIHIIVRTRLVAEIEELHRLGAEDVLAEEFETSIEIFTRVLERYHVPRNVIQAQRKVLRGEGYELFRKPTRKERISETILEILAEGATDIFRIDEKAFASGKTLAELDVRKKTGASIIAVVRGQESFTSPKADFRIEPHDFVVLVGGHAEIDAAFAYLGGQEDEAPEE